MGDRGDEARRRAIVARYRDEGLSIRAIVKESGGITYGRVRAILLSDGVELRGKGGLRATRRRHRQ